MPSQSVNGHIQFFMEKHDAGIRKLESEGIDATTLKAFSAYTLRKFLTQYCQERIIMTNRYYYELIPRTHYQLTEEEASHGESTKETL